MNEDDWSIKYTTIPGFTVPDYTFTSISDMPSYEYVNQGTLNKVNNYELKVGTILKDNTNLQRTEWTYANGTLSNSPQTRTQSIMEPTRGISMQYTELSTITGNLNNCFNDFQTAIGNWYTANKTTLVTNQITQAVIINLSPYIDKKILDSTTNKVYTLRLTTGNRTYSGNVSKSNSATLQTAISNISWLQTGGQNTYAVTDNGSFVSYQIGAQTYNYVLEELGMASAFDFTFKANVRKLPRSAVRCVNIVSDNTHTDEELAQCLMLAQTNGINEDNTTGRILDIQYLPFSVASSTNSNFKINNDSLTAQFLDLDDYTYHTDLTDLTNVNKETDTIKIVSPSRASQYLFSPYNNNGNMIFDTKITLKPYASVIYVRPSTQGLLMYDWDDKDCLIIQEDFSLTNVTSQWTQYIYNNKNYSNIFERELQGREFERSWERRVEEANMAQEKWNAKNLTADRARAYSGNLPIISDLAAGMTYWFGDKSVDQN